MQLSPPPIKIIKRMLNQQKLWANYMFILIFTSEPGNGQVFMAHVVYIDFLKILNSVIFWHVYTFLWLWKHFEVHLGNGNVIYALNHF